MSSVPARETKRCTVCARFRSYDPDDSYCRVCGHESLESACDCGRSYDYALEEHGDELHCPRCGKKLRGRSGEYE